MITGSLPAIPTPLQSDGSLDIPALKRLLEWHVAEGTDGIVVVGTTGESPTVSVKEQCELIKVTVDQIAGRIPVIAGAGGNSTAEAIELARFAQEAGADAHLSVVPYYNKPTQEGMYQHFKAIAEAVPLPMILYNVPGRTVADLSNETILRLAQIPNIVGLKDATGNIGRGIDLLKRAPKDFAIYSGDDATAIALILLGARGNISVTANIAPRLMHEMVTAALAGNIALASEINNRLISLNTDLFVEANPIPVKWAVQQLGLIGGTVRLPLTELSPAYHEQVRSAMRAAGIQV